jgi:ankyrin repeat protein
MNPARATSENQALPERSDALSRLIESASLGRVSKLRAQLAYKPGKAAARLSDARGSTALAWAAACGRLDCANLLLPHSDSLQADVDGMSPLMLAALNGHEACVELLLPVSDPNQRDAKGFNALMLACSNNQRLAAEMLLGSSDLSASSKHGQTASEIARAKGFRDLSILVDEIALSRREARDIGQAAKPPSNNAESKRL